MSVQAPLVDEARHSQVLALLSTQPTSTFPARMKAGCCDAVSKLATSNRSSKNGWALTRRGFTLTCGEPRKGLHKFTMLRFRDHHKALLNKLDCSRHGVSVDLDVGE